VPYFSFFVPQNGKQRNEAGLSFGVVSIRLPKKRKKKHLYLKKKKRNAGVVWKSIPAKKSTLYRFDFSPTVRREYSSFGERSSLLSEILALYRDVVSPTREVVYSLREVERVGFFVFFSNREVFFSLSLSLEYICNIYSFFLCSLYFFS